MGYLYNMRAVQRNVRRKSIYVSVRDANELELFQMFLALKRRHFCQKE